MANKESRIFENIYRDKSVLVTGHTGFKGGWLVSWLLKLGARVIGFSNQIPTRPSIFVTLQLQKKIEHNIGDIRDEIKIKRIIEETKPDFIFHLAAQAIVSTSYDEPLKTISTNVLGTANLLESLKNVNHKCIAVIVTSDKCYENVEWAWGYKETDRLGGRDIYSGSKGAAEVIFNAYYWSYFRNTNNTSVRIATGRAGNVIGGGDWANDRIIVDCIKNWSKGKIVKIRNPMSTRPWQHVLEPLSGYLGLGLELSKNQKLCGESFNFGPKNEKSKSVETLIKDLRKYWEHNTIDKGFVVENKNCFHEASLLKLNCDKASFYLKWEATLDYEECIKMVGSWYSKYYENSNQDLYDFTISQIKQYEAEAIKRGLTWTK